MELFRNNIPEKNYTTTVLIKIFLYINPIAIQAFPVQFLQSFCNSMSCSLLLFFASMRCILQENYIEMLKIKSTAWKIKLEDWHISRKVKTLGVFLMMNTLILESHKQYLNFIVKEMLTMYLPSLHRRIFPYFYLPWTMSRNLLTSNLFMYLLG